jgi:Methane oxygenase PmoA
MRGCGHWIAGSVVAFAIGAVILNVPALGDEWRVTVRGVDVDLGETPIVTEVPASVFPAVYRLSPSAGGDPVAAQVFEQGQKRFLAFVVPRLPASRSVSFTFGMHESPFSERTKEISIRDRGPNLAVFLDGESWTEYRVDVGSKPIFFPLIGPTGDRYTRAYPMEEIAGEDHDHPHQRSCWFTHGSVNGVDFWSEGAKAGKIKETHRALIAPGPAIAQISTTDDWLAPGGARTCSDDRTVTFYRTQESRVIDFEFKIRASDGPLTFGDTKEGMFGIRVASSMDVTRNGGGRITNAEGLTDEKAWGKPSPWVDYAGPIKEKTVGIAVLNHPGSFRYPTTWHVRTYGLFAANPFGWHDFGKPERGDYTVSAGATIVFKYRVILHAGDTNAARLAQAFSAYAKPPAVEVVKN